MERYIWNKKGWFDFKYNKPELMAPLSNLRLMQGKLLGKISQLDIGLETEAQAEVLVEEAVRTAEIEGMILDRRAVRSSVAERLGLPGGVGLRDRNAEGLVDVLIDAIRFNKRPLTFHRLHGWQAALFPTGYSGLNKIRVGKLRGKEPMRVVSGPIGREKVHFTAPPYDQTKRELDLFIRWWNSSFGKIDGVLRAAAAHLRFITIHPYEDGNGRIARALTDMALAQDENLRVRFYSMSSQIMKSRNHYYAILEDVQNCRKDVTEWFLWFFDCMRAAIKQSHDIIANVFMKAEFWRKHAYIQLNDRQKKVVQKMLTAGQDGFIGGLTTRKYVGITKTSRATAFREINELVHKKILIKSFGKGRNVSYKLSW